MKKLLTLILAIVIAVSSFVPCFAEGEEYVDVYIEGQKIEFDVRAQIIDGRTMVPMRKIFETLGLTVKWFEKDQVILATSPKGIIVSMKIGANKMSVADLANNNQSVVELDVPPMLLDSRTLVPVRAISESLGYKVGWDETTYTVSITK